jgi:hypothetical protein
MLLENRSRQAESAERRRRLNRGADDVQTWQSFGQACVEKDLGPGRKQPNRVGCIDRVNSAGCDELPEHLNADDSLADVRPANEQSR